MRTCRDDLERIKAPTLVLEGDHDWSGNVVDPEADESLNLMRQRIPQLEVAIIPDSHSAVVIIHKPEECARIVLDFLRRHPLNA